MDKNINFTAAKLSAIKAKIKAAKIKVEERRKNAPGCIGHMHWISYCKGLEKALEIMEER